VPGGGQLTSAELEKVNGFVKKAFPRKDDRNDSFDLREVRKLIALIQCTSSLIAKPELFQNPARIPVPT